MDRPDFHRLAEQELNEAAQYYELDDHGARLLLTAHLVRLFNA